MWIDLLVLIAFVLSSKVINVIEFVLGFHLVQTRQDFVTIHLYTEPQVSFGH